MAVDHPVIEQRLATVASDALDADVDWTIKEAGEWLSTRAAGSRARH
jgi:hypothetical protein